MADFYVVAAYFGSGEVLYAFRDAGEADRRVAELEKMPGCQTVFRHAVNALSAQVSEVSGCELSPLDKLHAERSVVGRMAIQDFLDMQNGFVEG